MNNISNNTIDSMSSVHGNYDLNNKKAKKLMKRTVKRDRKK